MATMSGLIRPEGGVNAKRRSLSTSVLIYLMDVPSVSEWGVWLGPSVTQLERAAWPVALRVPGQEWWQKGQGLARTAPGNFHSYANLGLETGKRDSQMTQVTLKGKIKAGSSQAIVSRLIFSLLAKEETYWQESIYWCRNSARKKARKPMGRDRSAFLQHL